MGMGVLIMTRAPDHTTVAGPIMIHKCALLIQYHDVDMSLCDQSTSISAERANHDVERQ